jgi:hypothetical protein
MHRHNWHGLSNELWWLSVAAEVDSFKLIVETKWK